MNKLKFLILILLPTLILLIGTVSSLETTIQVESIKSSNTTVRKYTQFNITAPVNDSFVCDVTYTLPKQNDTECKYECGKFYYRIEEDPTNINKFYFCPTKYLACRDNSTVPFKPLSLCWSVTCFPNNASVKVDTTYTVLCVDPNPPKIVSNSTDSNSSNSINSLFSQNLLLISFVILIFIF
ncbi:hypothetical protein DICPUDRAFT_82442 [Dictyostelium purpureum]|uniref:Transmembrane protein n=1 Tax=Dictyostelium purpureum TaxID=5786 RepID=F0ZWI8_DICPU|nr:uncharacterized protein DICPUDRAFT_82442 [Dictyostelium purpureum]EGC31682.1 hypothetical protein DICPUDRAFT_82442 [Dictyostelium purpureum]|eukprot:XP_003291780.1 hypothetical protein DICPUDRAFT_82442 [Dictyostelium purpureum]